MAKLTGDAVQIVPPPDLRDLEVNITVGGVPITVFPNLERSEDGTDLVMTSNLSGSKPTRIPFGVHSGLAGLPVLLKPNGDADHGPGIAILANLYLSASSQYL